MILKIIFSKPENGMRIDNQHYINGFIHKCLGKNNKYHNSFSDYAISSLQGGKLCNGRLVFNENPYILVSSENSNFINDLMAGILTTDVQLHQQKKAETVPLYGAMTLQRTRDRKVFSETDTNLSGIERLFRPKYAHGHTNVMERFPHCYTWSCTS